MFPSTEPHPATCHCGHHQHSLRAASPLPWLRLDWPWKGGTNLTLRPPPRAVVNPVPPISCPQHPPLPGPPGPGWAPPPPGSPAGPVLPWVGQVEAGDTVGPRITEPRPGPGHPAGQGTWARVPPALRGHRDLGHCGGGQRGDSWPLRCWLWHARCARVCCAQGWRAGPGPAGLGGGCLS